MKKASLITLLACVGLPGFTSAAWLRLPSAESAPVNLANPIVLGTQVHSSSGITNPAALIADSSSEAATLSVGKGEAILSVGEQQLIDGVSFVNDGAAGKVVVSASGDSKTWTSLSQAGFTETDRQVAVKFAGSQAKYIRFAFDSTTASTIRNIKLSGPATTKDYKAVAVKDAKAVEVNLASSSLGAQPIYMFPTPSNAGEGQQSFKFPKTKERYRTVVYDLGAVRTIKKFNAAYSRVPTRLQVFAFEQLPEKKDWRGKLTLDPAVFDDLKPVATGEDARGDGSIQLVPERPVQAQFVALRFEPNYNKRAVTGLEPDWQQMAFAAVVPFAGMARELGLFDSGTFIQAAGEDDFVVYDAAAGGSVPLVLVSRAAIALVMQNMGPNASESDAVNSILTAAGFTPMTTTGGGPDGNKPKTQAADASNSAPGNTAGLNALGLSAYRGGGGGGGTGGSPFSIAPTGTTDTSNANTTTTNNNDNTTGTPAPAATVPATTP